MSSKLIIVGLITCAIISCKPKQASTSTKSNNIPKNTELTYDEPRDSTTVMDINISERNNMQDIGDPYTIVNAEIIDDILWIKTSYGGGCKEHFFEMLFNNAYLESFPPSISLTLKHNGNEDHCRAMVQQTVRFNLKPIQDQGSKSLVIHIHGWKVPLTYNYAN